MALSLIRKIGRTQLASVRPSILPPKQQISFNHLKYQNRNFKVSSTQNAAPLLGPLLVKLSTPIYRFGFLLLGRRFRKYWNSLPPEQKAKYTDVFTKSRKRIYASLFAFGGLSSLYYVSHLEDVPVTKRRRFMMLNGQQLERVVAAQWRNLDESLEKSKLPVHHPSHQKVFRIVKRILTANESKEVNALTWEVNVIEADDVNAFVLANGQIYVFTGIMDAVENENELAGILGHEIAHAVLNHSAELLSLSGFFNVFSVAIFTLLWAIIPTDAVAVVASLAQNTIEDLLINLPYSRKLEREADEVGLLLAARACYDVRYVPRFWHRMSLKEEVNNEVANWFSTHPTNADRVKHIDGLLPEALQLRTHFQCPELTRFFDVSEKFKMVFPKNEKR